jgi:uncharacterized protein YkwD
MKAFVCAVLFVSLTILSSFKGVTIPASSAGASSPLAEYSPAWNDAKYLVCNTAAKANYMTETEKQVIYIINLARMNPSLFANTVIKKFNANRTSYYNSLLNTMLRLKPVNLLYPDSLCFAGAECHAISSGQRGYVGHDRSNDACKKKWYFNGECCDYGHNDPLDIIMALLIDEGVSSLGHREICLGSYKSIGVSIQLHKVYSYTAVLDFHF